MAKTTKTCNYPTGTAGSGPRTCGKPAKFLADPAPSWFYDHAPEGVVCGVHKNALARRRGDYTFTPLT